MVPRIDASTAPFAVSASRGLAVAGFIVMIALVFVQTLMQMKQPQVVGENRVQLERLMAGTADKPFVFRQLVPSTVRLLDRVTPTVIAQGVRAGCDMVAHCFLPKPLPPDADPLDYYFLAAIMAGSLLGYAWVGRRLYHQLFPRAQDRGWTAAGLLAFNFLLCTHRVGHVYDFTVLLMMMSLLSTIARERHGWYLLVFALSCLNKETTVYATVAYTAYFAGRVRWRFLVFHVAAQIGIFSLIYGTLSYVFANNLGQGFGCFIELHKKWLLSRGLPFYLGGAVIAFMACFRWSEKPLLLRRGAWMVAANLVFFIRGGFPAEWRGFYESAPLLALLFYRNFDLLVSPLVQRIMDRSGKPASTAIHFQRAA